MFRRLSQLKMYAFIQTAVWTTVVGISLAWNITGHRREAMNLARQVARTHIDKDILFRRWNDLQGSVYVPISPLTPPNPHIDTDIVPERDIVATDGRRFTLMNPAYMTRQVYELSSKENQVTSHLTSLTPIRPENRPDQWESTALQAFEHGGKEASAVVVDHVKRYLRLMKPLTTGENCLRCHAHQGYKLGDNRGGISVTLPMEPFESSLRQEMTMLWVGHGSLWLLGILGILAGTSSVKRHMDKRNQITEELEKANVQLQQQASTDILTGICNRLKCVEVMQAETARAKRYNTPLSLIMFDIDHFKAINDTWGHDMGDRVLIEVTTLVVSHVRASDLFARWGGEEFMIVCPGTNGAEGTKLAEKLRLLIAAHGFAVPGRLTCSFGVATLLEADSEDSLCKRADVAMYLAKRGGRNRVEST